MTTEDRWPDVEPREADSRVERDVGEQVALPGCSSGRLFVLIQLVSTEQLELERMLVRELEASGHLM